IGACHVPAPYVTACPACAQNARVLSRSGGPSCWNGLSGVGGRVGATMTRYRASLSPKEEEEEAKEEGKECGIKVCVVYGCLSSTSMSNNNDLPLLHNARGKQLNMFMAGFEGVELDAEA
ncbi:MAG: hypothetical protein Q9197_007015, partial [Variospora fuerteventurae]